MQSIYKWFADPVHQVVAGLLLGGLVLRTAIALWLYPGFDEAYYYVYTLYPDWSYFDHPLLVMITTGIGPWLTGEVSQLTIRLGTLVLYTGTLALLYLTSQRLFDRRTAVTTLAIATILPFFGVSFGTLTLPDVPLMFFWTASLYCAADEFFPGAGVGLTRSMRFYQPSYRLALLGVLVGLACLGKYHGFILGLGLVGFCLTSPNHRRALTSPWAGVSLLLFLLTILPLLGWNWHHDWASFRFQSMRTIPNRGYSLLDLLITFLVYTAYLFPTLGFPLWWVTLRATWTQVTQVVQRPLWINEAFNQKQQLILWSSLPLILGFTVMGGYRQVLPSWPMPGFWTATLLLGYSANQWQQRSPRLIRRWLWGSALVVVTLLAIALSHVAWGIVQKPSTYAFLGGVWEPKDDPSTQLIDVQQLRQGFVDSPTLRAALAQSSFVFTNRFFLGGQVAMALTPLGNKPVTVFDEDLRGFAYWSKPDQWVGQDGLYVTSELFQREEDLYAKYGSYFERIERIGEVPIRRGGAVTAMFQIYQTRRLLKPYPRPYGS